MNDRPQGGSSLNNGVIELMQNRRLMWDDYRGVEEGINEKDAEGYGESVSATYYLQVFNYTKTNSVQRHV